MDKVRIRVDELLIKINYAYEKDNYNWYKYFRVTNF
jgi:hypothetical protein